MGIFSGDDHGEAYVTVEAQPMEAVPMLMSAEGSNGEVTVGAIVKWEGSGGITGHYGWEIGSHPITPYTSATPNHAEVNNSITNVVSAMPDEEFFNLWDVIPGCITRIRG